MRLFTLLETTAGVLEVETKTVPWIWTLLTFGLFHKAECRIGGPALERYHQLKVAQSKRFNSTAPSSTDEEWARETKVFRTIRCRIAFWHDHMVEYVQAQGRVISDHHRAIQWHYALDNAVQSDDIGLTLELLKDEEARSKHELEQWRKRKPF